MAGHMILAYTGHRPSKLGGFSLPNPTYVKVCQATEKVLRELKPEKVLSGFAIGFDQYGAYIAHKLGIPFEAIIPFDGQCNAWPAQAQRTYHKLLKLAANVVIVSEGGYSPTAMQKRNEYLVDHCDQLLACWDGSSGGTKNCLDYVATKKKPVIRINPKEL
jgi:uncharacterized phage-like protein YoqJ